jgi:nucleoside-diphosphate-sugar epimerase
MQDAGQAVVSVSPGGIYGGEDPRFGEQYRFVHDLLKRRLPVLPRGGFHAVDVGDAVATVAGVLEPGRGPRRYIVPGHHLAPIDVVRKLSTITGRPLPAAAAPARILLPAARLADLAQRHLSARLPVNAEGLYITACNLDYDDSRARSELGVEPQPFEWTLAEMVSRLLVEGRIKAREAGRLGRPRARRG